MNQNELENVCVCDVLWVNSRSFLSRVGVLWCTVGLHDVCTAMLHRDFLTVFWDLTCHPCQQSPGDLLVNGDTVGAPVARSRGVYHSPYCPSLPLLPLLKDHFMVLLFYFLGVLIYFFLFSIFFHFSFHCRFFSISLGVTQV